ncbi:MAG: SH3 domain-containing protein [Ginsengibacter sp.]
MSISKKIKDLPVVVLIIFLLLGIVILYRLVIFLSKAFVYLGFNLFLVTDNLLKFESANPIILWGLLGLFIGSIFGVMIAIKKYKLSKTLILYPLSITFLAIVILSFINKPTDVSSTYAPTKTEETATPPEQTNKTSYYTVIQTTLIWSGYKRPRTKLCNLPRGTQVEVLESVRDSRNNIWYKIPYIDPKTHRAKTGYVNANDLSLK